MNTSSLNGTWALFEARNNETLTGSVPVCGKTLLLPDLSTLSTVYVAIALTYFLSHHWSIKYPWPLNLQRASQVLLINVTLIILSPLLLLLFTINILFRLFLTLISKTCYNDTIKMMDAADNAWAPESYAHCNNFTALYILEGDCNLTDIQERIRTQLAEKRGLRGELVYWKMHYSVVKKFGYYCWEKKQEFNVKNHVRLLDDQILELSEDALFAELQKFADKPMSDAHPQWEMLIVPRYIYNDSSSDSKAQHFAIIFRIHHSIMDGVSAGHALKHILADYPIKFAVDPLKPLKISPIVKLMGYAKCAVLGPSLIVNAMLLRERNCFHKGDITGPKSFGWSRPVSVEALKSIKNATRTTITAVLTSAIGGSIRSLALKKKLEVPQRIQTSPTVAILPYPDISPRNRFVCIHYPLEIGLGSATERLESANDTAKSLATSPLALAVFTTIKICGTLPSFVVDFLMSCVDATVILSNVPGPAEPAYLFGGHLMVDSVSWVPLKNWIGIGVCLFSYAGRVRANFVTDKSCMPEPTDVTDLIRGFENELDSLATSSGVPVEELFISQMMTASKR